MKNKLRKLLCHFPNFVQEFFEMVFSSAAENHIKLVNAGQKKFRSYTQLKRHQKNVRRSIAITVLVVFSWVLGILVGPIFFPSPMESEIYIPNGKGDVLIANISKNKATVIFKTLDSANGNKPLATKATVEMYEDPEYTKLERRTNEDDYAVTHIVSVDSLQDGKLYYIKIIAKDAAVPAHTKTISSWGSGSDPVKVYTTGELIPNCIAQTEKKADVRNVENLPEKKEENNIIETGWNSDADQNLKLGNEIVPEIIDVLNENHLQPGNKIQTIISWLTNVPASTIVTYGEQNSGEKRELLISDQLTRKHAAVLTTLKAGTTYYFKVQSKDGNGNILTSEEYSLRTPRAQANIIQKISSNFKELLGEMKIY